MMTPLYALSLLQTLFGVAMFVSSVFIILLVLVQRGRGGGLAGALGGMGGQSAFGAKAGDQFTWITWIAGFVWVFICIGAVAALNHPGNKFGDAGPNTTLSGAGAGTGAATTEDSITPTDDAGGAATSPAGTADPAAGAGAAGSSDSGSSPGANENGDQ